MLGVLILSLGFTTAQAQDQQSPEGDGQQAAAAPPAAGAASAAKAQFQQKFQAWKDAIKEIDQLRIEYQTADPARRQELEQELQKRFQAANELVPGVVDAALVAYNAVGGQDEELTQFLVAVAAQRLSADLYEDALGVVESLIAQGVEHPAVPLWGAIAAFTLADYDAARKFYEQADASGILSQPPSAEDQRARELWILGMTFRDLLDAHEKAWAKEQAIRAAEDEADDLPRVVLKTSKGDITLELFENEAPNTVKNFITLVEQGAYDGTAFHRVLPNFMAQGGDPTTAGKPEPGYTIPCECYEANARKHFRGTLSMAHAGRDTGNAQFFLTFRPTPHLDGQTFSDDPNASCHTVFGRVSDGIDVLAEIQRVNPQSQNPQPEPDRIVDAEVLRKRPGTNYGDFNKLNR